MDFVTFLNLNDAFTTLSSTFNPPTLSIIIPLLIIAFESSLNVASSFNPVASKVSSSM